MLRATYSVEDNKLRVYPDGERVDSLLGDEYAAFKQAGYKWAAKQECFVCPRWTPQAEDWALRLAEEIEDEDYSATERSADRAERFGDYREKRADEAGGSADTFEAGPQAFGHQNRDRAERQASRHDRSRRYAVSQWSKAAYWQQRTEGVIAHALYRAKPAVRRSRILRLESEQRKHEKSREEYARRYAAWKKVSDLEGAGVPLVKAPEGYVGYNHEASSKAGRFAYALATASYGGQYKHPRTGAEASLYRLLEDSADPITPNEAAALWLADARDPDDQDSSSHRWTEHYKNRLAYERAMMANEGGSAAEADMEPGGWIHAGTRTGSVFTDVAGGWMQIHGVNKSPATGRVVSVKVMGTTTGYTRESGYTERATTPKLVTINIERLPEGSYREPTAEERAAFREKKKAAPKGPQLINPTDEAAEQLQAIWNKPHDERRKSSVVRMTQAEYTSRSSHSDFYSTRTAGTVKVRSMGRLDGADRVIILTDKPQRPLPLAVAEPAKPTADEPADIQLAVDHAGGLALFA